MSDSNFTYFHIWHTHARFCGYQKEINIWFIIWVYSCYSILIYWEQMWCIWYVYNVIIKLSVPSRILCVLDSILICHVKILFIIRLFSININWLWPAVNLIIENIQEKWKSILSLSFQKSEKWLIPFNSSLSS